MVWDVRHPEEPVFEVPMPDWALAALSPDGRRVFIATTGKRPLRCYDVASGRLLHSTRSRPESQEGRRTSRSARTDRHWPSVPGTGSFLLDPPTLVATPAREPRAPTGGAVEYSHDGSMLLTSTTARRGHP